MALLSTGVAERQGAGCAASFDDTFGFTDFAEEFDPLAVDEFEIDQEEMDDDNPYDTVDYPTMRNMPQQMQRDAVYSPARQGGARNAISMMIRNNPAHRPMLLAVIGMCEGGCASSEVSARVEAMQKDNRSVYAPMTLCRMLERAGALTLEMPETAEAAEDIEAGATYLEIKEQVDPVWHATAEGLEVRDALTRGDAFRDIVLDKDATYLEVYEAVMDALSQGPCARQAIEDVVDAFEVVKHPRRFGSHFIDMLELSDVIEWREGAWCMTTLGAQMLPELKAARRN